MPTFETPPILSPPVEEFNQRTGFRRAKGSRVFLEIAGCLWTHPGLREAIVTWIVPGRPDWNPRGLSIDSLTPTDCPAIDLWPEPREGQQPGVIDRTAILSVRVTIVVSTIDPLDALDYWGGVEESVYLDREFHDELEPEATLRAKDRTIRYRLAAVGGTGEPVLIGQPDLKEHRNEKTGRVLHTAEGMISTTYYLKTE